MKKPSSEGFFLKNHKNLYLLIRLLLRSSFLSGCGWLFGGRNFSYSSPSGVTFACAQESSEITIDPKLAETAFKYAELMAGLKIKQKDFMNQLNTAGVSIETKKEIKKKLERTQETLNQLEKYMLTPKDAMKKCDDFLAWFHRMRE